MLLTKGITDKLKRLHSELDKRPLIQLAVLSFFLNFTIESLARHSVWGCIQFIVNSPLMFLLGMLILAASCSLSLLFPKRYFVLILISALWLLLGITNFILLFFKIMPLSFIDFLLIESVFSIVTVYLNPFQLILAAVFLAAVIVGLVFLWCKTGKQQIRWLAALPTVILLLSFSLLSYASLTPTLNKSGGFSNLSYANKSYGFVYCFTVSAFDRGIKEPEDYSESRVENILASIAEGSTSNTKFAPNIIMLQLESFIDANYLEGLSFSENPVPVFTSLKKKYPYGFLTVPSIGAGTANTEFEILSGMCLDYFGTGEYPYKTILQSKTCETICYNLGELGYSSHAIHNNKGTFYDRDLVFSQLGFDTYTPIEYMNNVELNPLGWAKDACLAGEIMSALNSTSNQDFVYAISVQPHGKYPSTPISDSQKIKVSGLESENETSQFEYYVNQLHETDAFIGELIAALDNFREPTLVVLYGDHLPSLNLEEGDLSSGDLYQTEYIIWSNYYSRISAPDLEAYQLSAYVMGLFGFDNGLLTRLHQQHSEDSDYLEALAMLEYDMLYGDMAAYGGMVPYEPKELRMGVKTIAILDVSVSYNLLRVKGAHFTPYSVVYINDKAQKTLFMDSTTLLVAEVYPNTGDVITVAQQTSDGNILGSTYLTMR